MNQYNGLNQIGTAGKRDGKYSPGSAGGLLTVRWCIEGGIQVIKYSVMHDGNHDQRREEDV